MKLTSVIIFPLVLFLSLWLARFCFCCKTLSLVVRYSRANSLMVLQNLFMFTSRIAYGGCPMKSKKEWNLQGKPTVAMTSVLRNKNQLFTHLPQETNQSKTLFFIPAAFRLRVFSSESETRSQVQLSFSLRKSMSRGRDFRILTTFFFLFMCVLMTPQVDMRTFVRKINTAVSRLHKH